MSCRLCGGLGVFDVTDDEGRPLQRDIECTEDHCPDCDGAGRVEDQTVRAYMTGRSTVLCKTCDGSGVVA